MKHALWLRLLDRVMEEPRALRVVDTHAGAGLYDLDDPMARRSQEAEAGVGRLLADLSAPAVFDRLKAAVQTENPDGALKFYPGSPLITVAALRGSDAYVGCELRADDQTVLQSLLDQRSPASGPKARAILADGYSELGRAGDASAQAVYLIDPPFEGRDEYALIAAGVGAALRIDAHAMFAIWAPLKDLETFDALLRRLEALGPASILAAEARLRPLLDPMRMNGSAMILINAPDLTADAEAICAWTARRCGEGGGNAQVRLLGR